MQKDALIERVASVQALISRKTPYSEVRSEDQKRIAELRGFLYDNQLQQLDKHPKQDRDLDIDR